MSRLQIALSVVLSILIVVLFWLLIFQPRQEEIAQLESDIGQQEALQQQLESRIESLRLVRNDAPAIEAELSAARSIVTSDPALPSALRQFQRAADESGLTLRTVTTARPAVVNADVGLSSIALSIQLEGSYFQTVDFLRRVEDPAITARAVLWTATNIAISEYPELNVTLSGDLFTLSEPVADPADDVDETQPDGEGEVSPPGDDAEIVEEEIDL